MIGAWSIILLPFVAVGCWWMWRHRNNRAIAFMLVLAFGVFLTRLAYAVTSVRYCAVLIIFILAGTSFGYGAIENYIGQAFPSRKWICRMALVILTGVCMARTAISLMHDKPYLREYPAALAKDLQQRGLKHPLILVANRTNAYLSHTPGIYGKIESVEMEAGNRNLVKKLNYAVEGYDGSYLVAEQRSSRDEKINSLDLAPYSGELIYQSNFRKKIVLVYVLNFQNMGTREKPAIPMDLWTNGDFSQQEKRNGFPKINGRGYHLPEEGWPVKWLPGHYWNAASGAGSGIWLVRDAQRGTALSMRSVNGRITVLHQDAITYGPGGGIGFWARGTFHSTFNLFLYYYADGKHKVMTSRNFGVDPDWRYFQVYFDESDFPGISSLPAGLSFTAGFEMQTGTVDVTQVGNIRRAKTEENMRSSSHDPLQRY